MRRNVFRRLVAGLTVMAAVSVAAPHADAQYWQAAQQLQSLISPALSGSGAYKGSVEVAGVAGFGSSRLNHVEISTSQGYQYTSWFYMGAGIGVDIVRSTVDDPSDLITSPDNPSNPGNLGYPPIENHRYGQKRTGVMLPVFTDFRFNIPAGGSTSLFIDLRVGASWLLGNRYLETVDGYLTTSTNFYLRPSVGLRIPVKTGNSKQAVNIGVVYQLLTSGNNYWYYQNTKAFNAFGVAVSYEW